MRMFMPHRPWFQSDYQPGRGIILVIYMLVGFTAFALFAFVFIGLVSAILITMASHPVLFVPVIVFGLLGAGAMSLRI